MAAAEKVCEFSDDYPGWEMYRHKRNHIQVVPKYRKEFRGKEHTLYFFKPEKYLQHTRYGFMSQFNAEEMEWYEPKFTSEDEFVQYCREVRKERLIDQYWFALVVKGVPGKVDGVYVNWTHDRSAVKRRLKRMLRAKELNVINLPDVDYHNWEPPK